MTTIKAGLYGRGSEQGVPLLGVDVKAEVVAGHARAVVRQRYKNDEKQPIEAIYTFPLPSKAVLTAFSMTVEGRRMEGEVQEREKAFQTYDDAITAGHGAALLEQERPNVFTANVGNLLPGEETIIEIEYVEPVRADEGAIRWSVPTLVAPRYMPGVPSGDRTGHGTADPTSSVPDADRISPPIGAVSYGLALDLLFDVGVEVDVECPSHKVTVTREGKKTRVTFAQAEVPLDRDVVVTAFATDETMAIQSVVAHRTGETGAFALALVPDLGGWKKLSGRTDVVFVLDRSGSMGGASIEEAKTALRLCLRQLREGDRFGILAFDDSVEAFAPQLVPLTTATLQRADTFIASIQARGGTEMLHPLVQATELAKDGIVVLLTDGEVGNEDEIQRAVAEKRGSTRVYSFGIGTNVSDALLLALANDSGGAVEMIHPGERVDEKVVAQFARATALRVRELTVKFRGVEVGEIAPATPAALVDGEPFSLFGTYEQGGIGAVELRGKIGGETFYIEMPVDLPDRADRPVVAKLWAQARIRDLERTTLDGRRAEAMKDRIVRLAKEHGVSSKYTSFVVVEKRTGDRRTSAQAETRVVPVNAPAGWEMYGRAKRDTGAAPAMARRSTAQRSYLGGPPRPAAGMPAPAPAMARSPMPPPMAAARSAPPPIAPTTLRAPASPPGGHASYDIDSPADAADDEMTSVSAAAPRVMAPMPMVGKMIALEEREPPKPTDPILAVLSRQSANGLWDDPGKDTIDATIDVLKFLLQHDITAAHPMYGAQVKKAVEALVEAVAKGVAKRAELALALAWLLSSGRRTRRAIEDAARGRSDVGGLAAKLGDEAQVRAHVAAMA